MLGALTKFHGRPTRTVEVGIGYVKNLYQSDETWGLRYSGIACATANSTTARQASREHVPCEI